MWIFCQFFQVDSFKGLILNLWHSPGNSISSFWHEKSSFQRVQGNTAVNKGYRVIRKQQLRAPLCVFSLDALWPWWLGFCNLCFLTFERSRFLGGRFTSWRPAWAHAACSHVFTSCSYCNQSPIPPDNVVLMAWHFWSACRRFLQQAGRRLSGPEAASALKSSGKPSSLLEDWNK